MTKPVVHICDRWCKLRCFLKHHYRLTPEGKCRCCDKVDWNTAHELSRSQRSEAVSFDWHLDPKHTPTDREKSLVRAYERLLRALGRGQERPGSGPPYVH